MTFSYCGPMTRSQALKNGNGLNLSPSPFNCPPTNFTGPVGPILDNAQLCARLLSPQLSHQPQDQATSEATSLNNSRVSSNMKTGSAVKGLIKQTQISFYQKTGENNKHAPRLRSRPKQSRPLEEPTIPAKGPRNRYLLKRPKAESHLSNTSKESLSTRSVQTPPTKKPRPSRSKSPPLRIVDSPILTCSAIHSESDLLDTPRSSSPDEYYERTCSNIREPPPKATELPLENQNICGSPPRPNAKQDESLEMRTPRSTEAAVYTFLPSDESFDDSSSSTSDPCFEKDSLNHNSESGFSLEIPNRPADVKCKRCLYCPCNNKLMNSDGIHDEDCRFVDKEDTLEKQKQQWLDEYPMLPPQKKLKVQDGPIRAFSTCNIM